MPASLTEASRRTATIGMTVAAAATYFSQRTT